MVCFLGKNSSDLRLDEGQLKQLLPSLDPAQADAVVRLNKVSTNFPELLMESDQS